MKFTSIIFLFISVILIFGGIFAMKYARNAAGDDVIIDGYSYDENGHNSIKTAINDEDLTKIAITLTDCDIEIDCNAESSYIELNNFKPNTYICSFTGKSINVSDDISISDYLSFDGSGVKFSGVWQTLLSEINSRKYNSEDNSKSVVIHLKNYESLKQINLTINNSHLRLHDYNGEGDIKVNAANSTVELTNLSSTVMVLDGSKSDYSLLNIKATKLSSALKSGSFLSNEIVASSIAFEMGELDVSLLNSTFTDFTAELDKGKLTFSTDYDISNFKRDLETKEGSLLIGGVNSGSSFKSNNDTEYPASIKIDIKHGDMDATFGNVIIIPEPDDSTEGSDTPTDGSDQTENPAE